MAAFNTIEEAVADFKEGKFVLVVDSESRENEGDLIASAEDMTPQKMAFLVRHSSGYICVPLSPEIADRVDLPLMVPDMQDRHKTAYTLTCDAIEGTTTGISASDRTLTAKKLADPSSTAATFNRPGHMVPLRGNPGGTLARPGHTEAGLDLCKLSGKNSAAVISELVRDEDGEMARRDDCLKFARQHNLKCITIEQIREFILSNPQ